MATAFAALVSLQNNLRLIQNHPSHSFSFEDEQIESLLHSVCFLILFMKSFDGSHGAAAKAAEAFSRRIARAAHAAEDVIESHVVDQIHSGSTLGGKTRSRFLLDLQKAIEDMDFVRRKAVNVRKSQQPTFSASAASSTALAVGSAHSSRMVGFDDELLRLLDLLTGVPSSRRVVPIVGMAGIGKTTPRPRFLLDLQKVIVNMDSVTTKAMHIWRHKLEGEDPEFSTAAAAAATSSTPLAYEKNRMVGFDDELLHLVDLLTGVPSSRRVIPIVGMGGIGKTTLATNAFQHSYILHYFDVRLWATVSQDYSVRKILTQLVSSLHSQQKEKVSSKMTTSVASVGELGEELYKSLFGRRYLIILDDMWSVGAWDEIKFFFPETSNGSRVVVTTRQSYMAHHFESLHLDLSFLDEGNSWDLFCQKTFENQGCPHELQNIGKKIVEKCRGLPLAIVVVGGHLRKSPWTLKYWENVASHMISILNSAEYEQSLDILSLSYRYLPVHLKPCFLFLGVFSEDQEIPESEVVNLWIGEGLIEQIKDFSLEDTAAAYLKDLTERNLISCHQKWVRGHGFIGVCRVHDLLRELCLKIAKKDEFLSVLDTPRGINKERRVLLNGRIPKVFHAPRSTPLLRSLVCEGGQLLFDLKLLRVLNKVDSVFVDKANFQQVNLRYLKVDVDYKSYLPPSICMLWNLQTLVITGAFRSIVAPYEIWEMLQLRHIEVDPICLLDPLPIESLDQENDLVLRKLHTLSKVENFRLSEEVCRRIPNIETLELSYCDEPSSNYCLHNLGCFEKLESLKCNFDDYAKWGDLALSFTFPSSLRRLNLSECRLGWKDLTRVVGTLPHLDTLVLLQHSVIGSVWIPDEGGFPSLKELFIYDCDLIHWIADNSHFPVLQRIFLCRLSELDEFPSSFGEIPTLEVITLLNCSLPSSLSAMRVVVEQEEMGNEGLQLGVSFKGDEETLERFKQKVEEEGLKSNRLLLKLENGKTKG